MLYSEIIAVCSEIHTKHTNTICGQNVELLNVKNLVVRIVNHWDLNCLNIANLSYACQHSHADASYKHVFPDLFYFPPLHSEFILFPCDAP
jgi:hypothetical protein